MRVSKKCTTCGLEKFLSEFRRQSSTKDGLKYTCKACDSFVNKKRYEDNKADYIAKVRKWQSENPDLVSGYKRKYEEEKRPKKEKEE